MAPSVDNLNTSSLVHNRNNNYNLISNVSTTSSPALASASSVYTPYNAAGSPLLYWSDDGGGGDGGGGGTIGGADAAAAAMDLSLSNFEGSGIAANDDHLHSYLSSSYLHNYSTIDEAASSHYGNYSMEMYLHCPSHDPLTNATYINITCNLPTEYGIPLYGYCMPFLMVITVLSNSLIVLILSKKSMATPTNFVLMAMAICDILTVIFPAPGLWYMYTFGNHYKPLHPVPLCFAYDLFNEVVPQMCHTASIWLTVALAVQRYIYVCHAPMARTWCTMPRVKRCTLYISLVSFLYQLPRVFDRYYYILNIEWNGKIVEVCNYVYSAWMEDYVGSDLYFTIYYLFRVFFVHLIPCISLVTLNILLFSAMRQAQERRKLLFRENRKKECKKLRESNCTTLMLIVVVTVFLIVEIPLAVLQVLHIVDQLMGTFMDYEIANTCITFANFILVVSYPINFGIYCGMSRQFRETFKEIFLRRMIVKKGEMTSKYSMVNGPRTCTNTNETVL